MSIEKCSVASSMFTPSRARSRSAIHANSCRRRKKTRRWPKPANGSSRHQELHHLLELPVSVAETREIDDPAKREELLQAMAHGSAASWGHLNLTTSNRKPLLRNFDTKSPKTWLSPFCYWGLRVTARNRMLLLLGGVASLNYFVSAGGGGSGCSLTVNMRIFQPSPSRT
jgi:hypothetical protein